MEKEDIKTLIDSAYEFEGMLHLYYNRPEDERAEEMLREKALKLESLISEYFGIGQKADMAEKIPEREEAEVREETDSQYYYEIEDDPMAVEENPKVIRKLKFSINEHFRFKRELFSNSDRLFNETMERIGKFGSFDEVEGLIYHEMNMSPESPEVMEFMEAVEKQF